MQAATAMLVTQDGETKTVKGKWVKKSGRCYFRRTDGQKEAGFLTIGKKTFWLTATGRRVSGSKKINGEYYYFNKSGVMQKACWVKKQFYAEDGRRLKKSTILELLRTGLEPLGQTMYIWGGGWNEEDTGSGIEARTLGVSEQWVKFFNQQDASYDYNTTRFQIHDGLDCSGYVGWMLYNVFSRQSGYSGFVRPAQQMASYFGKTWHWGSYVQAGSVNNYRAGDVCSSGGHVYVAVGQCSDGSVVLMHSSPPGVRLCGTTTPSGNYGSEAIALAEHYMKTYFPEWYERYPSCSKDVSYLQNFARMRWYLSGKCLMTDPEGLTQMDAAGVLKVLFGE